MEMLFVNILNKSLLWNVNGRNDLATADERNFKNAFSVQNAIRTVHSCWVWSVWIEITSKWCGWISWQFYICFVAERMPNEDVMQKTMSTIKLCGIPALFGILLGQTSTQIWWDLTALLPWDLHKQKGKQIFLAVVIDHSCWIYVDTESSPDSGTKGRVTWCLCWALLSACKSN